MGGFFQIVDHGVDAKLVSEMTTLAKEFFASPPEEKLRFDMSGGKRVASSSPAIYRQQVVDARLASKRILFLHEDKARPKDYKFSWGMLENHLTGEAVQDWREIVTFFSYPTRTRDYSRWPDKPEAWRAVTEEYSQKLMELACKLLGVLSEAMGLETEALTKACVDMDQKVVVNFYPKCPQPDLTLGLKRHTDPGTITLLLQDTVGGLQATRDNGKTWITVQPVDGAFVVNLGDHGHYLSNGRFKNADHQAVVNSNSSRLSIATFQNPAPDATVYPLKIREGEKSVLDEPITFAEMYRRKMSKDIEIAMKKKLAKEQLLKDLETPKLETKPIEEILA
ncbi:putative proteinRINGENIN2-OXOGLUTARATE 3-DIOXYGENASE [Salix koriyanagi]|uniref:Naringenin,2-oxoglutarate 3-dioxygenase n=1 Tax=Salix koriyanagi TaxID=2511006 RepID=A0A9Q0X3P9_9ROSI|nr:putative proteinRINGENIN2-OXOGLUTARATE 3-DIOXYGENASE [Salix koriyanagi]